MISFIHIIEALTALTIFVMIFQMRRHYVLANTPTYKETSNSSDKSLTVNKPQIISRGSVEFDYSSSVLLPPLDVEEDTNELVEAPTRQERATEQKKPAIDSNLKQSQNETVLDSYISDFFSYESCSAPTSSDAIPEIPETPSKDEIYLDTISKKDAVNDTSPALVTGNTL